MMSYFPPQHPTDWDRSGPEMAGFDPTPLAAAVSYAAEHETPWGRVHFENGVQSWLNLQIH